MPHDEILTDRVRQYVGNRAGMVEKKMFGGVAFLLHGNMCVGIWKTHLIARVGPDHYEAALAESDVEEFDITGRPMRGWVMVGSEATGRDERLSEWIDRCVHFVETLPKKK